MSTHWIALFFSNFSLVMFAAALLVGSFYSLFSSLSFSENIYRWVSLLGLGISGIFTFIMHAFFPDISAAQIGWNVSPFQYEVAIADLTTGVLGIIAFKSDLGFRAATVVAAMIWLWGDAIGHIHQMLIKQNFTPGNAGSWFWMDLIVPLTLLVAYIRLYKSQTLK